MFCIQCGRMLGSSDRFCCLCGARVPESVAALQNLSHTCSQHVHSQHAAPSHERIQTERSDHQPSQEEPERLLLAFGPLGYTLSKGNYSLFNWAYRNLTRFQITTRRFRTVHQSALLFSVSRTMELDIPMEAVVSVEHYPRPGISFGFMEILGIIYRTREGVVEISVCGDKGTICKAHSLMTTFGQKT